MTQTGPKKFGFPKAERLTGKKRIEELFRDGSSFFLYPYRVKYLCEPAAGMPHQVLISVPKKKIKKAVKRNLIKRRIREAYRLHKHTLDSKPEVSLSVGFIYQANEPLPYHQLEKKMIACLQKLEQQL